MENQVRPKKKKVTGLENEVRKPRNCVLYQITSAARGVKQNLFILDETSVSCIIMLVVIEPGHPQVGGI